MKNLLLSLFTFALASNAYTQTTFQKTFGGDTVDISYSVQKTGDGGYIITGYTQSFGAGNEDIYLIKTNTIGDTLWTKTFGGIGPDYGRSVKETTDNGYIIVGNANGLGPGGWDAYLIRVDSIGDTLWTKIYGGTLNDDGFSVQQTSNGGFVFTGYFYNSISGSYDIYLVNTNANGDTLWTKTYGGSNWDVGNFIIENPDGGYTIAGYTASFGAGLEDFYIIKTDSIGNSGGCNEFSTNTIVINPATQVGNGGSVSSGGIINNTSTTASNSPTIDSILCFACNITSAFTPSTTSICIGNNINFINISSGANSFVWQEDGIPFSTATDTARTFTTAGTYTISLIADSAGCSDSSGIVITVNPTYSITDPAAAICTGDSALVYGTYRTTAGTFYDSLTTVNGCDSVHSTVLTVDPTYSITTPDETICDGDSAFIFGIYRKTAGTYYDTLTAINGCDSVHSTALTVNPTYSITDLAAAICTGDSALIYGTYRTTAGTYYDSLTTLAGCDSVHSTALTVNPTYSISDPAAAICTGDSALIYGTYKTTAGTYYDSLTTVAGCDSVMATTLIVNPLAVVSFSGLDTNYCSTDAGVTLTGTPAGGVFSGTGGIAGNQFFPATGVNIYVVTYSYTDSLGCSNSVSQSVSVIQCTGIPEDDRIPQIKIYPNPNTGKFNIEIHITQPENLELKITNSLGQLIFKEELKQFKGIYEKQLELKDYPAGIYNLLLVTDKGVINKQIIIE